MPDIDPAEAASNPSEILATLEQCLVEIDQLGLGVVAVQLSLAIETLRDETSSPETGSAASN